MGQPGRTEPRIRAALRPWLLPAPLLAAAVVIGGIPGVILGWIALLLGIDRLLDRLGLGRSGADEADRAFRRLTRKRRRGPPLEYLAEDEGWVAVAPRRRLGVQPVPLDSLVGTVDRHKAVAFDRDFRPPAYSRGRWTLMFRAAAAGAELPPVSVYRVGGRHYVRDGHHRVSVAKARGATDIEAEVVELQRP